MQHNNGEFDTEYTLVGYMDKDLQTATKAKTGWVYMSDSNAKKQRIRHPDLNPSDYTIVQNILDNGMIGEGNKPNHYIGFIEIDNKWWRAVWKVVDDGNEVWFLSLTKAKPYEVKQSRKWIRK